jgi:hypothetical protein
VLKERSEVLAAQMKRSSNEAQSSASNKLRKVDAGSSSVLPKSSEDSEDVNVGYYDANFDQVFPSWKSTSVSKPGIPKMREWLEECKDDIGTAIRDKRLHVICIVGLGSYNEGLAGLLPDWLKKYDKEPTLGLLSYLVDDTSSTWDMYSIGSYGVIISTDHVKVMKRPRIVECEITNGKSRPMVFFEIVHADLDETVLQNQFQFWLVENEGNAKFPLPCNARETIAKFLMNAASDRAIWGGKLNTSLAILQLAGVPSRYSGPQRQTEATDQEATNSKAWTVLPSSSGEKRQMALSRNVAAEGFDIACVTHAAFFGVAVARPASDQSNDSRFQPIPEVTKFVTRLTKLVDESQDERTGQLVHEMLIALWWGENFRGSNSNAMEEGNVRLAAMLKEVTRVRQDYGGLVNCPDDLIFEEDEMRRMHNAYKDRHTWMNDDMQRKYFHKSGNANKAVKSWFNVHFNKTWGSKAFFMHLCRFGLTGDIAEMVRKYGAFRKTPEYEKILDANAEKSSTEKDMKLAQTYMPFACLTIHRILSSRNIPNRRHI